MLSLTSFQAPNATSPSSAVSSQPPSSSSSPSFYSPLSLASLANCEGNSFG